MPTNITGSMIVDKDGNKQSVLNFSNARRKTYAQWQEMTDAQKKGAVIVKDCPTSLIPSDMVTYGNGTVEDALDEMHFLSTTATFDATGVAIVQVAGVKQGALVIAQRNQSSTGYQSKWITGGCCDTDGEIKLYLNDSYALGSTSVGIIWKNMN